MDFCRDWEGFAGTLRYNQHVLAAAVKYGCAYVCSERPSWKTASHNTGAVDDWFGCLKGGVAVGDLAVSPKAVKALPVRVARFQINDAFRTRKKRTAGIDEPMLTGAAISLRPEPNENAVYSLKCPRDSRLVTFEATYPWLRTQFAAGRAAGKRSTPLWGEATPAFRESRLWVMGFRALEDLGV
ncbi:unnamed protein product [Symbiodinium sp. CCMP2592]|nr:unnamed protein product [Symbiodinium sp. CCMP2592]